MTRITKAFIKPSGPQGTRRHIGRDEERPLVERGSRDEGHRSANATEKGAPLRDLPLPNSRAERPASGALHRCKGFGGTPPLGTVTRAPGVDLPTEGARSGKGALITKLEVWRSIHTVQ